jgi:photosystem II stability/assembly factor-like uncharacterized protein
MDFGARISGKVAGMERSVLTHATGSAPAPGAAPRLTSSAALTMAVNTGGATMGGSMRVRSTRRSRGHGRSLPARFRRLLTVLSLGALALLCSCGGGSSADGGPAPSDTPTGTSSSAAGAWELIDIGQTIPATMPFQTLSFADADHGMAVTYAADFTTFVAVTADGGTTWSVNQVPRPQGAWAFNAISSPEPRIAWGVGTVGSVATSTDGGATWRYQRQGVHGQMLNAVSFIDATRGWAAGEQFHPDMDPAYKTAVLLHTIDGGETWTGQSLGTPWSRSNISLLGITFLDDRDGWAVGAINDDAARDPLAGRGVAFHTSDGGATWQAHQFSQKVRPLHGLAAVGASSCWAVGPDDTLVFTSDGGATWVESTTGQVPDSWLVSVAFSDEKNGWCGGDGALLRTADGGATWTKQASGTIEVWAIDCASGGTVIAAGLAADQAGQMVPSLWRYSGP